MTGESPETTDELVSLIDRSQFNDSIVLLPREEHSDSYIYESDVLTIQKVLKSNDIECELATPQDDSGTAVERSVEVGIPALLFLYALWRENKDIIRVALEKIGDYYIQRATREIEIDVHQENEDGKLRKFSFKGHPRDLPNTIMTKIEEEIEMGDYEDEQED